MQVTDGAVVATVEGSSVTASVKSKHYYGGGTVSYIEQQYPVIAKKQPIHFQSIKINDSKVVKADVGASNGVIHFIDSVLLPPTASV